MEAVFMTYNDLYYIKSVYERNNLKCCFHFYTNISTYNIYLLLYIYIYIYISIIQRDFIVKQ